jgi:hypothetical protein
LIDLITFVAKEKSKLFSVLFAGTGNNKNLFAPNLIACSIVCRTDDELSTSTPFKPFTTRGSFIDSSTNNG